MQRKVSTAQEAISLMTDEAERQNATPNDEAGIVREIVYANLPGRPDAQFNAWLCICCDLADRAAKRQGFKSEVDRAFTKANQTIAARQATVVSGG